MVDHVSAARAHLAHATKRTFVDDTMAGLLAKIDSLTYERDVWRSKAEYRGRLLSEPPPAVPSGDGGADVEKVARAIVEATSGPWERITEDGRDAARIEARAAIRAMTY